MDAYDLDALRPAASVPWQLARSGTSPTDAELREMLPGLRERDYVEIAWNLRRLTTPANRHERRALASRQKRARRATERLIELRLDAYEAILAMFTPDEKAAYDHAVKNKRPHPDGSFAPTAPDSELTELRRSLFEMALAFRMHNRKARAVRRAQKMAASMGPYPA